MNLKILIIGIAIFSIPSQAKAFCFDEAGAYYNISPQLLWSIAKTESNLNPKAINHNTNGTYDYGIMQINSIWAKKLGKTWDALSDPCTNVKVGAWILAQCIRDYSYTWQAVGCYNSRTPSKRDKYATKVFRSLKEFSGKEALQKQRQQPTTKQPQLAQILPEDNGILSVTPSSEVTGDFNSNK